MHFPHPSFKNGKRFHRIVVLPDYQGLGLGMRITNQVAQLYKSQGYRVGITTTHPALCYCLKRDSKWGLVKQGRVNKGTNADMNKFISLNRITSSWFYKGN